MNLENYTLVELRQLAKEKKIKNSSKLKKDELIHLYLFFLLFYIIYKI